MQTAEQQLAEGFLAQASDLRPVMAELKERLAEHEAQTEAYEAAALELLQV